MALTAGAAHGQDLAYFSTAEAVKQEGTLTVKVDGGSPVACEVEIVADVDYISLFDPLWQAAFPCENGTSLHFNWYFAVAWNDGGYYLQGYVVGGESPHGDFWGPGWSGVDEFTPTWTNGSGTTPSRVHYDDEPLGAAGGGVITVTGTLDATTVSGGPVTLN